MRRKGGREAIDPMEDERPPGMARSLDGGEPRDGEEDEEGGGLLSSPWFWIATVVVIGGGVAAALILLPGGETATQGWDGTVPPGHWDIR
jgi:hypothetical protein